jgi:hypothetical protein
VTTILLAGLGDVGVRAARQLLETEGIDELLIATHAGRSADEIVANLGRRARRIQWHPGDELPTEVDLVASALPGELEAAVASASVRAGRPCALATDMSEVAENVLELDDAAIVAGVTVAIGCGLAPGLSCVLAAHAAALFDDVLEIRVSRCGIAGAASERAVRHERRPIPQFLRNGEWNRGPRLGELVWFPEPLGARDCQAVSGGGPLLAKAFPGLDRLTWSLADASRKRQGPLGLRRRDSDEGWGAVRVEVFGRRGGAVESVIYGLVDRTALAAGVVLAAATARLAGVGTGAPNRAGAGVHSLAAVVEPVEFLGDLAARGVRAAAFEGAPAI